MIPGADVVADLELTSDQLATRKFYRGKGCDKCNRTGYKGRLGLHELLSVDPGVRHLIQTSARPEEIQHAAMRNGHFRTLRQDGIEKVLQGLTSIDEVRANCN